MVYSSWSKADVLAGKGGNQLHSCCTRSCCAQLMDDSSWGEADVLAGDRGNYIVVMHS